MQLIVEVGMKLNKNLIEYHEMLTKHGLWLDFSVVTYDVYYVKGDVNFDGMTENEMKNACTRIRKACRINGTPEHSDKKQQIQEGDLIKQGYHKVFDTIKFDFQYKAKGMKSAVQLQDIKDVGLLCYYDNPEYYHLPLDEQRHALLEELNSYGFEFKDTDLGVDKLRTLYYGKEMKSKNQNG